MSASAPATALLPPPGNACTPITNQQCQALATQFHQAVQPYGGAALVFPVVGMPDNPVFPGTCTIAHTTSPEPRASIEGYVSRSPLANAALFSTECAQSQTPGAPSRYLSFYEAMVPDTAHPTLVGNGGGGVPKLTSAEVYANTLSRSGVSVAGNHYHWNGMDPWMAAIHHQQFTMPPDQFVALTTRAYAAAVPPGTTNH